MWKTPLFVGSLVETHEGVVLQVLHLECHEELAFYCVTVRVVGGAKEVLKEMDLTRGTIEIWNHLSPSKFVSSLIVDIRTSLIESAEEEFFNRNPTLIPLHKRILR